MGLKSRVRFERSQKYKNRPKRRYSEVIEFIILSLGKISLPTSPKRSLANLFSEFLSGNRSTAF